MLKPHHRMYLTAFFMDSSVMVMFATAPFFVFTQIGGDETMAGAVGAIQMIAYALSCLISARFVAQTENGLRWAFLGVILFIFFSCLMPLRPTFPFCATISFLAFAALGLVWPALQSWIGAEPDAARRAQHMAIFSISAGCGFALSPLLGGPLFDLDYRLPFIAVALLGVAILTLIRTLPHEKEHFIDNPVPVDDESDSTAADGRNWTSLLAAWNALFVLNVLVGATRSIYPKRVMDLLAAGELRVLFESGSSPLLNQGPATTFSWLVSTLWIATAVCYLLLGRWPLWPHQMRLLLGLQVLAGGASWLLGNTQSLLIMLVCFAIVGVSCGVSFFVAMTYSLADPRHKHRRAATTEGILGVGGFAGSIGFGYLAGRYEVVTPFLYTPILIIVGLAIQVWLLRRVPLATPPTPIESHPVH